MLATPPGGTGTFHFIRAPNEAVNEDATGAQLAWCLPSGKPRPHAQRTLCHQGPVLLCLPGCWLGLGVRLHVPWLRGGAAWPGSTAI